MLTQTAVLENVVPVVAQQRPEPIRERRWNRVTRQFEWYDVTPAMIEATKRREQYCAEFGIYA